MPLNKTMKNDSRPVAAAPSRPLLLLLRWDVPVPTGNPSLYFAVESTGNRHCLWTSSPVHRDTWGLSSGVMVWTWRKSGPYNWTTVVSSLSLINQLLMFHCCRSSISCSTSAFTAAVIFIDQLEPGLLSKWFISLCFCRNMCSPIQLAIKPSSRNIRQIVGGL